MIGQGLDFFLAGEEFEHSRYDANPRHVASMRYFTRYLLQKAMSPFKWNFPENWASNYFLYCLYRFGFVCVSKIEPYGVIPQHCTINSYDIYYNPATAVITNPLLNKSIDVGLGVDGELITLSPDYRGIMDCVYEYAEMLSNASCAVNMDLYNSRMAYMFYAENESQSKSFQKMYDEIGSGKPAVFVDKKLFVTDDSGNYVKTFEPFNADLKQNYIVSDVLEDMRRIEHMFAQKIGLPNTNTEKRERMSVAEVDKTDVESVSNIVIWYENIQECIKNVKKLFPELELECEYRYETLGAVDTSETNDSGGYD